MGQIENIIITTAEESIGYKPHVNNHHSRTHDNEIHQLSLQKKQLHIQAQNTTNNESFKHLKHQCNQIAHEIERSDSDSKIFKAVQNLYRKSLQNKFVHDKEGKLVTNPQEIHDIIREHFSNHFYNADNLKISPYVIIPKALQVSHLSHDQQQSSII